MKTVMVLVFTDLLRPFSSLHRCVRPPLTWQKKMTSGTCKTSETAHFAVAPYLRIFFNLRQFLDFQRLFQAAV
jgi:hypothetical protein